MVRSSRKVTPRPPLAVEGRAGPQKRRAAARPAEAVDVHAAAPKQLRLPSSARSVRAAVPAPGTRAGGAPAPAAAGRAARGTGKCAQKSAPSVRVAGKQRGIAKSSGPVAAAEAKAEAKAAAKAHKEAAKAAAKALRKEAADEQRRLRAEQAKQQKADAKAARLVAGEEARQARRTPASALAETASKESCCELPALRALLVAYADDAGKAKTGGTKPELLKKLAEAVRAAGTEGFKRPPIFNSADMVG
mmetsp:Transcript_1636/g.3224  ORF Transcript_1636/g.3224 Transcript_1636/m.3224 type:complete len:248 (+) Transcript_1636:48-791(+)